MRTPVAALALTLVASGALARGDALLLPPSGFLATWRLEGAPRIFTGSELYGWIDGGAEIFLELGFEEATIQRYRGAPGEVVVELYRMTDPVAALGLYLGKCGSETPDPALSDRHTAGRYQLMLVRDRYFAIVNDPAGTPALARALVGFAAAIAGRLPAPHPLTAFDAFPKEGVVAGSLRLVRGPVGLEAIATLGQGDVLLLGGRVTAVAGKLVERGETRTLVVAPYPDVASARAAFRHLVAALDPEITPLDRAEDRLVFRDFDGTFGQATLAGARIEIALRLRDRPRAQ